MAAQNTTSAAEDMQRLFDPRGYQDLFRTWARYNERMASVVVEAASKTSEIANGTAQEAFSNLRDVTAVKEDPSEYAQAYNAFAQKRMELFVRTARSFGEVGQNTGQRVTELASEAGDDLGDRASDKAGQAADRTKSAARKAA